MCYDKKRPGMGTFTKFAPVACESRSPTNDPALRIVKAPINPCSDSLATMQRAWQGPVAQGWGQQFAGRKGIQNGLTCQLPLQPSQGHRAPDQFVEVHKIAACPAVKEACTSATLFQGCPMWPQVRAR